MEHTSGKYVKNLLKRRPKDAHKGVFGKVLIVAGSEGMAGAAILSAKAALRAGAGLVRVSIDSKLFPIIQTGVPEATCIKRDLSQDVLREYDAVVVGPGIGTESEGTFAVAKVMQNYSGKVVFDADALNVVAKNIVDLNKTNAKIVITPHLGEAARLMDKATSDIERSREKAATYLAMSTNTVTVLKGHDSLIALPKVNKQTGIADFYVNTTGNPGMATGGSGDVLSGVIGAFMGQGMSPEDAAVAGVYIHGLAGDMATKKYGEYGLIAGDIAEYIGYAIKDLQGGY